LSAVPFMEGFSYSGSRIMSGSILIKESNMMISLSVLVLFLFNLCTSEAYCLPSQILVDKQGFGRRGRIPFLLSLPDWDRVIRMNLPTTRWLEGRFLVSLDCIIFPLYYRETSWLAQNANAKFADLEDLFNLEVKYPTSSLRQLLANPKLHRMERRLKDHWIKSGFSGRRRVRKSHVAVG